MKQHITIEQLNELSDKGKDRLREWWKPEMGDLVHDGDTRSVEPIMCCEDEVDKCIDLPLPILSIGQMIEFLFDKDFGPIITSNDTAFYWIVEPEKKLDCWKKYSYEDSELCDALWEATKDILQAT